MRNHCSRPYFADCARTIPRALEEAMGPDVPPLLPLAFTD